MVDELIAKIKIHIENDELPIIGISGFGGSGKTVLTKSLASTFFINDKQVIHLDNLFAKQPWGNGIFDNYDWDKLLEILNSFKSSYRLSYVGRGFLGEDIPNDVAKPQILLVEGVRLFKDDDLELFDERVWINCPLELATKRGKERDRQSGKNEEHIRRWDSEWEPKDKEYEEIYKPKSLATFLYEAYK